MNPDVFDKVQGPAVDILRLSDDAVRHGLLPSLGLAGGANELLLSTEVERWLMLHGGGNDRPDEPGIEAVLSTEVDRC